MFGAREASWPLIRHDLGLQYVQVGLLLSLPEIVSNVIEPVLGVLGDTGWRRRLILGGGVLFCAGLVLVAASPSFLPLLLAFALLYPASGAFVSLSQATLMDLAPARREQNMARWNVAGSVGAVAGPLLLAGFVVLHLGWRPLFAAFAVLTLPAIILASSQLDRHSRLDSEESLLAGLRDALRELRQPSVLRWLALLECADLLTDVLLGYLALYFVDVAGATVSQAALAVTVWTGAGLVGSLLLLPLLARLDGLLYLRASALASLIVFPLLLLAPGLLPKLLLVGSLALINAGWYPVLQARLYAELPERSGTAMAVGTIFGTGAAILPIVVGLVAQRAGLHTALWLLTAGPIVILLGLPRSPRLPSFVGGGDDSNHGEHC